MRRPKRITFHSFDGEVTARVGSGDHCAIVMIEDNERRSGIVLTDDEAIAMGYALVRMGRQSREVSP